jgi:hypothetical protein
MSDELPQGPAAPEKPAQVMRDTALEAFRAHAQHAKAPLGRARSVWRARVEPWLIAAAALGFAGWAIWRVFFA